MADKIGAVPPPGAASAALDFTGRVAFVTGAASGQGRQVVLEFARAGADIVALDVGQRVEYPAVQVREGDALHSLREEVEALGRRIVVGVADVRDDAAVSRVVNEAAAAFGRIDVLFNNAGVLGYAEVDAITDEALDATIDINLKGPMIVTRRVVPHMKAAGRGVIINNSSIMGLRGGARLSHYAASKWGLTGLTKSWAIELAPFGIRVVSIHPTGVNTQMNDSLAAMEGSTAQEIGERSAGNLLPVPWIETEDVAALVLWLASDKARYATGAQYPLDAGLLSG
ncbi:MAG: SDR family NAD(P)-dependent oxidoreductase [Coriobacteriales bacterium]|jgi:NAD(P)-dependent dehydrogenase (short-subunit alcohol dehydrogenase family)|nr:SDR family NAD(P)-dependent oxidoreductase [Coriobacteriales bacterium]